MTSNTITSKRSTTGRKKMSQDEHILSVARRLFSQNGYSETSLDDIARVAKVNKGIVFYYFKKKSDILYVIGTDHLRALIEKATPVVESRLSPDQKLAELVIIHLEFELSSHGLNIVGPQVKRHIPPAMFRTYAAMRDQYEGLFCRVFEELCGGKPQPEICRLSLGMLNAIRSWYKPRGKLSAQDYARLTYRLLMNGISGVDGESSVQSLKIASAVSRKRRRVRETPEPT